MRKRKPVYTAAATDAVSAVVKTLLQKLCIRLTRQAVV